MSASRGGDMARTVILPTLAHSTSSICWWYFLANLMNLCLPTSSPNLSRFWLMRGLILTLYVAQEGQCECPTWQQSNPQLHQQVSSFYTWTWNPTPLTIINSENIDVTINQEGQIEKYCDLWIIQGTRRHQQRFFIANLGHNHLILGHLWFRQFNPTIAWARNTLQGEKVHIKTAGYQTKKWCIWRTKTIPIDLSIPLHYCQHTKVFDEEATKHFPPSWEEDC